MLAPNPSTAPVAQHGVPLQKWSDSPHFTQGRPLIDKLGLIHMRSALKDTSTMYNYCFIERVPLGKFEGPSLLMSYL